MPTVQKGNLVERNIEGTWFHALVEDVDIKEGTVTLKYLDDNNEEEDVSMEDIRFSEKPIFPGTNLKKSDTLPKPLAGLVEDDYEFRSKHRPTVFVHDSSNTDETIVMNGAENKQPAGGGLRALRHLKK